MCIIDAVLTHSVLQNFPAALVMNTTCTLHTANVSYQARPVNMSEKPLLRLKATALVAVSFYCTNQVSGIHRNIMV